MILVVFDYFYQLFESVRFKIPHILSLDFYFLLHLYAHRGGTGNGMIQLDLGRHSLKQGLVNIYLFFTIINFSILKQRSGANF